jgi:branched-chain amino acid aminotransferase
MLKLWKLDSAADHALTLPDMSSLDAVTRQLPDGFYSTFRTYHQGRAVLGLKAHLARLYDPARALEINPAVNVDVLRRRLNSLLEAYRPAEARIRLVLTRSDSAGDVYVAIELLKRLGPEVYTCGVSVETVSVQRHSPRLKSTAFISQSNSERKTLASHQTFEGLIVKSGKILEGMTSNFFYVRRIANSPYIATARYGILLGVTRREVIRVARRAGYGIKYQSLEINQIWEIAEAFITSSSRGIVPVVEINGMRVGSGNVGPVTGRLIRLYEEDVERRVESIT